MKAIRGIGKILEQTGKPLLMGILNITTDSFSDGGMYLEPEQALRRAEEMICEGADILDIGAESTRPGASAVPAEEQIRRIEPVLRVLAKRTSVPISVDTTSCQVARMAIEAGAAIINDISAMTFEPFMAKVVTESRAGIVLMHMQGTPATMQKNPTYGNVVSEVKEFLQNRIRFAQAEGIEMDQIIVDPGIGFGKTLEHNLLLLRNIEVFHSLGVPLLVGPSRKAFIGKILHEENPENRVFGTAATVAWCLLHGVQILRVHDVKEIRQVREILLAIRGAQG